MAHYPSRLDTSHDPYSLSAHTPEHTVWARTMAHPGHEQHGMAGTNLPSRPDATPSFGGLGTSKDGACFQDNVVSIYTCGT